MHNKVHVQQRRPNVHVLRRPYDYPTPNFISGEGVIVLICRPRESVLLLLRYTLYDTRLPSNGCNAAGLQVSNKMYLDGIRTHLSVDVSFRKY